LKTKPIIFIVIVEKIISEWNVAIVKSTQFVLYAEIFATECIDGHEITQLTTEQGKTAYVVYGEFACSEDGHLCCGTGGCPFDIVIKGRRYSHRQIMRLLDEPPDFISVDGDGSLAYGLRGAEFIWSTND